MLFIIQERLEVYSFSSRFSGHWAPVEDSEGMSHRWTQLLVNANCTATTSDFGRVNDWFKQKNYSGNFFSAMKLQKKKMVFTPMPFKHRFLLILLVPICDFSRFWYNKCDVVIQTFFSEDEPGKRPTGEGTSGGNTKRGRPKKITKVGCDSYWSAKNISGQ